MVLLYTRTFFIYALINANLGGKIIGSLFCTS